MSSTVFAPGHTVVTVRHRSRMNELNLVQVPIVSDTNTAGVLGPESKASAFSDVFELDKPASPLLPNRGDPVFGTNSPDGQETHPVM